MKKLIVCLALIPLFTSCNLVKDVESKAEKINHYEKVALHLSKENRKLKAELNSLEYKIQQLKSKVSYLNLKIEKNSGASRKIASIGKAPIFNNDMVQFSTYHWSAKQLKSVAENAFAQKNYKKSAQYYYSLVSNYPAHESIKDDLLFKAGLSAYETGEYYDQSIEMLSRIVKDYPTSAYYRGAKLWLSLAELKKGNTDFFFKTVEEFRKKYRNTAEWKIISRHYYEIVQKYKKM
jgi:TolA-binding protein